MNTLTIDLPDVGEGVAEAELCEWSVAIGESVEEDQVLAVVMTDKAAVEIPSPVDGKVVSLHGDVGEVLAVGSALIQLETDELETLEASNDVNEATINKSTITENNTPIFKPLTSPVVRKLAREHNINLQDVPGTGKRGRILKEDFLQFLQRHQESSREKNISTPLSKNTHDIATTPSTDTVTIIKMSAMRRKIAEKMQQSKQHIPHFSYGEEVDMTALETMRNHLNKARDEDQPKLTLLPFLSKAITKALKHYPQMNCRYDDTAEEVMQYSNVHLGIAAQTPHGLTVPVVHNIEQYNLWECAEKIADIAGRAKAGKTTAKEMTGSTITISSLGPIGGMFTTPIINYPEVAIIGVNKLFEKLVLNDGEVSTRQCMNLSASFDHRVIDGVEAAEFIQTIKRYLENPALAII